MLITALDRMFLWARGRPFLYRFTLFTRMLLAAGFIPTGMVKLLGHRFTTMSVDTPIGSFFEAMYQTGLYWRFLGLTQLVAGLLLLAPPLAHLGALAFLGIMTNIVVITVSLGFRGTPVVTGLMLLAVVYLCMWDYHRFRSALTTRPPLTGVASHELDPWERAAFGVFAGSLLAVFLSLRSLSPVVSPLVPIAVGCGAGVFGLARFIQLAVRGRLTVRTAPAASAAE